MSFSKGDSGFEISYFGKKVASSLLSMALFNYSISLLIVLRLCGVVIDSLVSVMKLVRLLSSASEIVFCDSLLLLYMLGDIPPFSDEDDGELKPTSVERLFSVLAGPRLLSVFDSCLLFK